MNGVFINEVLCGQSNTHVSKILKLTIPTIMIKQM